MAMKTFHNYKKLLMTSKLINHKKVCNYLKGDEQCCDESDTDRCLQLALIGAAINSELNPEQQD